MRSLLILSALALPLIGCVDVHNPPPQQPQQPSAVVVPAQPMGSTTTTVITPGQ
jgi:hypothetical protein